jgi:acetyl esterase/lipase
MMKALLMTVGSLVLALSCSAEGKPGRVLFDVPYAQPADDFRRLDVYAPEGRNLPVVVWVHGGAWIGGDKTFAQHKPRTFTARGYVFVPVNYRLVPTVRAGDQATDVATAIAYVKKNCAKWGGNPQKLFVMGHSAGTHLATLVCTDQRYLEGVGLKLSDVRGCVAVDVAGYDIPPRYDKAGESLKKTLADIFGATSKEQSTLSPVRHVARGKGIPPFLVIHIGVDPQKSQSEAFVKVLKQAGINTAIHVATGKGHKKLDEEMGKPTSQASQAVYSFLESCLQDDPAR